MPSSSLPSPALNTLSAKEAQLEIARLKAQLAQVQAENDRLRANTHLRERLRASLNLEELLASLLEALPPGIAFDSSALLLVQGDQLRVVAAQGFDKQHLVFNVYPRHQDNSAWDVVEQQKPLVLADVRHTKGWERRAGLEHIRAWMGVPLVAKEAVIAVLTLDSRQTQQFSPEQAQQVMAVATQAVIAVENAALFETVKTQRDQMAQVQELNQSIASILDLDALLQATMRQITRQLGSKQCSLWLFEPDGHSAQARAWYSAESQPTPHQALNLLQHPVMQQMLTRHEPLIITQVDSFLQKTVFQDVEQEKAFSILVIPLRFKEGNIGFIVTDNTETREAFLSDRLTLATSAANQAALAIHAATLFESVQKQANRLQLINEVAQQINTVLDVDDLFAILVQAIHHRLGYLAVTMFVVAQDQNLATLRAVTGQYPSWLLPYKYQQALFSGATEQAIAQNGPLLVADIARTPHLSLIPHTEFRAGIVVPIYINQSSAPYPAALFMVHSDRPNVFDENDLWTLETLGKQVGIAIENARLYRDATERLNDMATLNQAINETSQAISNILAMDDLFANVTHLISELFNQARVGLGLRTANYITFQHVADGLFTNPPIPPHHRLKIDPAHILGQVLLQGEAKFVAQLPTQSLYLLDEPLTEAQSASKQADSAAFVVPLNIGGKTIGLIVVQSRTWLESQTQDMETLQALASQVAVAMENSRLLQKSREMAIEQERTRLARDMHDGVAQNLAYLLLQVDRCITMAESNNPRLIPELDNMGQILQQNIEELRRHIFNLRPVGLVGRSFFKAIPKLAQEFAAKTELNTTYHITGEVIDIPAMVENSLYRILQEALSNVRRHAKCQSVTINLHINADHSLKLQVQDDGQGFDPQQMTWNPLEYHGLGLISIKERMRTLGGTFTIQSQPGQGTILQADVPNLRQT